MQNTDWIKLVDLAEHKSEASEHVSTSDGLSGAKLLRLLAALAMEQVKTDQDCYVEIGVYRGLTLSTVGDSIPDRAVYGIDNFTQFDPDQANKGRVLQSIATKNLSNVELIDQDYERALPQLGKWIGSRKVSLYFVDGPHDYRSQIMCLLLILPFLSSEAVVVVDDCNYEHVRLANADFMAAFPEFRLVFEAYTPGHPEHSGEQRLAEAKVGWWNGVNVLARGAEPNDLSIPTGEGRRRAEALHLVQSHTLFDQLPDVYGKLVNIQRSGPFSSAKEYFRLLRWLKRLATLTNEPQTYSDDLRTRVTDGAKGREDKESSQTKV